MGGRVGGQAGSLSIGRAAQHPACMHRWHPPDVGMPIVLPLATARRVPWHAAGIHADRCPPLTAACLFACPPGSLQLPTDLCLGQPHRASLPADPRPGRPAAAAPPVEGCAAAGPHRRPAGAARGGCAHRACRQARRVQEGAPAARRGLGGSPAPAAPAAGRRSAGRPSPCHALDEGAPPQGEAPVVGR